MAYVVQADVERAAGGADVLIELSDLDADGTVDASSLAETINDVERWIDSYIEPRHTVPLTTIPDIVRRVCAQEVVYLLKQGRNAVDQRAQEAHEANERWLELVAAGRVGLGLTPAAKSTTAAKAEAGDRSDVAGATTRTDFEGFV